MPVSFLPSRSLTDSYGMFCSVGGVRKRQCDLEQGTAARIILNRDVPAIGFDRPLRDRQTETGAATVTRARFVETKEAIEDAVTVFCGDAGPIVGDFHDRVITVRPSANVDRRSLWTVLDGVVDEICDRLAKSQSIHVGDRGVRSVDSDSLGPLLGKNRERRHHVARELAQIDRFPRDAYGSRVAVRE